MKLLSTVTGVITIKGCADMVFYGSDVLSITHEFYNREVATSIIKEIGFENSVSMVLPFVPNKKDSTSQLKMYRPAGIEKSVFTIVKENGFSGELIKAYWYFVVNGTDGKYLNEAYQEQLISFKEVLHNLLRRPEERTPHIAFNKTGDYQKIEQAILDEKDFIKNKHVNNFLLFLHRQMTSPTGDDCQRVASDILQFVKNEKGMYLNFVLLMGPADQIAHKAPPSAPADGNPANSKEVASEDVEHKQEEFKGEITDTIFRQAEPKQSSSASGNPPVSPPSQTAAPRLRFFNLRVITNFSASSAFIPIGASAGSGPVRARTPSPSS